MIGTDEPLEPPAPPAAPRRRRLLRLFVALLLTGSIALAGAAGYVMWASGGTADGKAARVVVDAGDSGARIAQKLEDAKIVRSAFVFRLISRIRGVSTDFKPGAYDLHQSMSVSAVLARLRTGVPLKVLRFTIPEGKTTFEIAKIIGDRTPISSKRFMAALNSGRHRVPLLPAKIKNLEGLLFPNTYEIVEKTTADQLVALLLSEFTRQTAPLQIEARAKALGISPYEAVIVASLVEREARVQKDRPLVASVIYNRLDRPMRLQIDATVQYAIYVQTGVYKGERLTPQDYERVKSPYNTYLIDGLPPTPIGVPGLAALQAALNPARTEFFFYRTRGSAEHCFSTTQEEHARCR